MSFFAFGALVNAITSTILGVFVYTRNRKDSTYLTHSLFSLFVAVWSYFYFAWQVTNDQNIALFCVRALMMGAIFIPICYLHHVLNLFGLFEKKKKIIYCGYAGGLFFCLLNLTPLFVKKVSPKLVFKFWPDAGIAFLPFLILWVGYVLYGMFLIINEYISSTGVRKNQLRYVLLGNAIGWIGGATNYPLWFNIPILPVGNIFVSGYMILITYAILKHRLMNIRIALTRGAILIIVYACIVGVPFLVIALGKTWLVKILHERWFYPPLGIYSLLALLAPYIYLHFQGRTEQKKLQQQMHLHQSLKAASKTTIEVQSIDKLSKIIPRYLLRLYSKLNNKITHISLFLRERDTKLYTLRSSVGGQKLSKDITIPEDSSLVTWFTVIRYILIEQGVVKEREVEVLVYEDIDYWMNQPATVLAVPYKGLGKILKELKQIMRSLNASVILPSVYQKELLGFLILGEKTPDPYSTNDIDTFSILANDSAMAFKAAQLFEELKEAEARLIQSEKLNILGQLASSMAHEINNPLAIISGNVQLLLMDETDDEKKKLLKKINDSTERGYKIINRLLNFSRLPKEDIQDVDMNNMVDETLELVNHKILHSNIHLERNYNPVSAIKGNPTQIQEVLLNLFVNAVQAMPQGGRLKIYTKEVHNFIEVQVEDTGKGIPEEDVKHVFDPFYTKGKEEGTGLGLFVADQIMKLHKGSIHIKSEVGVGTTFMLKFLTMERRKL